QDSRGVVLEDEVRFHYTIWLPDGTRVESTVGGVPHEREVILLIPGVAEGILGMRPEGRRKLVVRPELGPPNGYGSTAAATTVVFEIQLITILT
ncbi:MAG TPA: FKBP-type peptidyl-prolyl cis-trans isomerase, partial [Longimicrobiales bacterium]|nr:FKBP-type peptidyl-prolyl cis-trans isomerase [Longimicrobiales bacterium]